MRQKLIIYYGAIMLGTMLFLAGCNNGTGNNNFNAPSDDSLTISSPATVPVHANSSSSSVIYIHNNNDTPLTDISYQALTSGGIGGLKLTDDCKTIDAHDSCALGFTTPRLYAPNVQGSGLLIAAYKINDKSVSVRQIINYSSIQDSNQQGLQANTDTAINSLAGANSYGVIYLYNNQYKAKYNLTQLNIDNPQLKINNSSDKQLNGNQIVALEIANLTPQVMINSQLKVGGAKSYNFSLNAQPVANGAILTSGQVPLINVGQTTNGQLLVLNSGNANATLGTISATAGITIDTTNIATDRCLNNTNLTTGTSCSVYFKVSTSGGNGIITVPYGTNSLQRDVIWYNPGGVLLQMTSSPTTLSFDQSTTLDPITIIITNIGSYNLTDVTVPTGSNTDGGSATTVINTPLSCKDSANVSTGTNLPIGGNCTYAVTLTDTIVEINKKMLLGISGNYITSSGTSTYSRYNSISYTSGTMITITNLTGNIPANVMGTIPTSFKATISGYNKTSTLTATLNNSVTGTIISDPSPCDLTVSGTTSCNFTIIPWYSGFENSTVGLSNFDPFIPVNTAIDLTATNSAAINGTDLNSNHQISYSISTPYIYLPQTGQTPTLPTNVSTKDGADGYVHTGIPWAYTESNSSKTPSPRFTDDGCQVTDNLTGLIWVKNLNLVDSGKSLTWNSATITATSGTWCNNAAGTWRMPNINELASLINYAQASQAAWLNTQGFNNVQAANYWSSSSSSDTATMWYVNMISGRTASINKSGPNAKLLPVRGGW